MHNNCLQRNLQIYIFYCFCCYCCVCLCFSRQKHFGCLLIRSARLPANFTAWNFVCTRVCVHTVRAILYTCLYECINVQHYCVCFLFMSIILQLLIHTWWNFAKRTHALKSSIAHCWKGSIDVNRYVYGIDGFICRIYMATISYDSHVRPH